MPRLSDLLSAEPPPPPPQPDTMAPTMSARITAKSFLLAFIDLPSLASGLSGASETHRTGVLRSFSARGSVPDPFFFLKPPRSDIRVSLARRGSGNGGQRTGLNPSHCPRRPSRCLQRRRRWSQLCRDPRPPPSSCPEEPSRSLSWHPACAGSNYPVAS